jgi:alkylation response protein AidB-like acyl-CoA dehydrogenase
VQLEPSEDQQLFCHGLERFLARDYDFEKRRSSLMAADGINPALWQGLAELGLFMLPFHEEYGGAGLGPAEVGAAMEVLGRHLVVEPVIPAIRAGHVLASAGNATQRDRWLVPLIAGETRVALAEEDAIGVVTCATSNGDGWRLDGGKSIVAGGLGAGQLIVSALDDAGVCRLFFVPPDAAGLIMRPVRTLDGARAADLVFASVILARDALLPGDALKALEVADRGATIAACGEAVGVMTAAFEQTADYLKQREQFGRAIASFQSVQHHIAEMAVACEEARAAALLAALRRDERAVSAARVKVAACADFVAKTAVQLHGGMGVSDELSIASAFRKLFAFAIDGGGNGRHLTRYIGSTIDNGGYADSVVLPPMDELMVDEGTMSLALSPRDVVFRAEVRAFLAEHLSEEMKAGQAKLSGVFLDPEASLPWQRVLADKGWAAPLWPQEYGGTGWTGVQRVIFETECALAGAPLLYPLGLRLVGPVLTAFGNEEQKRHYLPRILSGEDYWAQGFSEPGAGSDLASLSTRAVIDGDDYIVDGSKIWTTHAHHANRMFTLVRTDSDVRKQDGISFLIIDLDTPGVDIKPIISIGGEHDVNQVFLDGVRVPRSNLIGEPNRGWSYAKYLLEFERGAGLFAGRLRASLKRIGRVVARHAAEDRNPLADPMLRARFAGVAIDVDVFEMLELKILGPLQPGGNPGPISSVLKLRASQLKQAVAELGVAVLGRDALRWVEVPEQVEEALLPDYLNSRAATIFGGAREVQLGIIARSLAGL